MENREEEKAGWTSITAVFDSKLSEGQCSLLERYGLSYDWRKLTDDAYSDLYEKVGNLIIKKGVNESGDGENELGERLHDILDRLYDAYPDGLLVDDEGSAAYTQVEKLGL